MSKIFTRPTNKSNPSSKWPTLAFVGVILTVTAFGFVSSQHESMNIQNSYLSSQ